MASSIEPSVLILGGALLLTTAACAPDEPDPQIWYQAGTGAGAGAGSGSAAGRGGAGANSGSGSAGSTGSGVRTPDVTLAGRGGAGAGGTSAAGTGMAGSGGMAGGAGASGGSGGAGSGGSSLKPKCKSSPDQVIVVGDSYLNWGTHTFPEDLAREAGETWRMYAVGGCSLGSGGLCLIPDQLDQAIAEDPNIIATVMTGGGNDILIADEFMFPGSTECKDRTDSATVKVCQDVVTTAIETGETLMQDAADAGIRIEGFASSRARTPRRKSSSIPPSPSCSPTASSRPRASRSSSTTHPGSSASELRTSSWMTLSRR
jgi:hypothetical protein